MKWIKASGILLVLFLVVLISSALSASEQSTDPWKKLVNVDVKDASVPEVVAAVLKGTQISYSLNPQGSWPNVTASMQNVPVDSALKQILLAAKVAYRIEGTSVIIAKDRSDLPAQSIKLKISYTAASVDTNKKTENYSMDVLSTGAEGSPMCIQNTGAGATVQQGDTRIPVTYTLSAQVTPTLVESTGKSAAKQISLSGSVNLSIQIPYFETVSTVVGDNVINQSVPRFLNNSKSFAVGTSVPLDTPTVIAGQTETSAAGKITYTVTVTASLNNDSVVIAPAGRGFTPFVGPGYGGFGNSGSFGSSSGSYSPPVTPTNGQGF